MLSMQTILCFWEKNLILPTRIEVWGSVKYMEIPYVFRVGSRCLCRANQNLSTNVET